MALAARNEAKLAEVAAEIRGGGGTAEVFVVDMASEESIKAGAKAAVGYFGSIEILVNNAGITKDGLLLRMKREIWDVGVDKNVRQGGAQVEYEDQDPRIHAMWLREIAANGVASGMGKFIDESRFGGSGT